MQIIERGGEKLIVLPGALLHEEDHQQVSARAERKGQKFSEALADYVRDLRENVKREAVKRG